MKKGWKIALISLGSLLGVLLLAVCIALYVVFNPRQLTKIVNRLAADYVMCETKFGEVDLTLFKTFPDAGLKVSDVYVINPMEGAPGGEVVAYVGNLTVGVDVKKFFKEGTVVVHQVLLDEVTANLYIDKDGNSNFDIFPKSEDEDTSSAPFSLDSLPEIDLRKVKISNLDASLLDLKDGLDATLNGVGLEVEGRLQEGIVDADIDFKGDVVSLQTTDSIGDTTMSAQAENLKVALNAKGNMEQVAGKLKLELNEGLFMTGGIQMVSDNLYESSSDLLTVELPFDANLKDMTVKLGDSRLKLDDYALNISGDVRLDPMWVDVAVETDGEWQAAELLEKLPKEFITWKKGMDLDAKVALRATAKGSLTDSTMPLISAQAQLADGRFYMPTAVPYKVNRINADLVANLDLGNGGVSDAVVKSLKAHTQGTDIKLSGSIDDLLGDMRIDAALKAALPLEDLVPILNDSSLREAGGDADVDLKARFRLSDLDPLDLNRLNADASIALSKLDVVYDSIHAVAPKLDVALRLPATEHKGKMADVKVVGPKLKLAMGNIDARIDNPDLDIGLNDVTREQVAAAFDVKIGDAEANIDSMMVSLEGLKLKGSARLDSTQQNIIRQYNPDVDIDLHGAVLYMPELPDAVRLSQLAVAYRPDICNIRSVEVKLAHSDFQLYGDVENVEGWIDHKKVLRGDLNFTSGYADVDQLLSLISGMGTDPDTLEQMRQEDNVPADANPFIVPKDVDLTLHTHIKRSVAFGNDLNDVAGAVTMRGGKAVLDQIGFVCKAATMQLTAVYESPRPDNLFVAIDFHLLDILIDELIDMIPTIDTLVPMLSAFQGNANFHLAAETYLNARYQPKMSTLLGAAAIAGNDLTVLDNNTIASIAKIMQFKSWKDKDNKIRIDSLDVELTCFRKVIEVYPFLLNIGKYQICASGMHSLDNQCGYHLELLKNPLMAKVGVDIKGDLSSPKISLGQVKYADYYRPDKQGVVEKQTLELKRLVKQALEAKVR
ncbi:MAG: AsmA family protein [Bacteroidales bacterium]|nr:AsmA family protein [Bacteroidales bacterium]